MSGESTIDNIPPGFRLRHTLRGHKGQVGRIAWSPDGKRIASGGSDSALRIWDPESGRARRAIRQHSAPITGVDWSPDGSKIVLGSADGALRIWDAKDRILLQKLAEHSDQVNCVAWSPDGKRIASGGSDRILRVWDAESGEILWALEGHSVWVYSVAWSPDGEMLASAGDGIIRLRDAETGDLIHALEGHFLWVHSVVWSPDGEILASTSEDRTIRLWDTLTGRPIGVLEGHTKNISCVSFSYDGSFLASKSLDGTVRLWRCDTWETVAVLDEPAGQDLHTAPAFHPGSPVLATLGEEDRVIRIWDLDPDILSGAAQDGARPAIHLNGLKTVHYANAKVVLVGDTGVGKTGLGLVLSGQTFSPTESTHGRHVWMFDSREVELQGGRKETRETLLWDLAGQPGYRLIHQLHLSEVAAAVVVFDARSEIDPFAGVSHWDRALRQVERLQGNAAPPMKKFLVAARTDRGGVGVSRARIESLVQEMGFDGYFEASAKEGWNIPELAEAIRQAIDWNALPRVSSTELFQRIKAFLVSEKEAGRLLAAVDDLYRAFLKSRGSPQETEDLRAQFETCIGRVEWRGLIRRLSFGNLILLQPELLDAYASAMVNAARDEPDGMGSIPEEDAREGRFRIPEEEHIRNRDQEKLLLIATVEDLLRHEIALREPADEGLYLVFPSQLTREHPDLPDPQGRSVTFTFEGPVLNIYATLAVRLSHSSLFQKKEMWKNAATYTARVGGTCGLFLHEVEEGKGEITLFFDESASEETRFQFEEYVSTHLLRRALPQSIRRRRIFMCAQCDTPVTDLQARRRRERGFDWIECNVCGEAISLLDRDERITGLPSSAVPEMDRAADSQRELDAGLVSAAAEMRTQSFKQWAGSSRTTLALVFTDVVGSTPLWNELGNEAMNRVRLAHFNQARRLVKRYRGHEIKTIGDAFMVAFRTAVDALSFALALYADTGHERIRIRAGIHVGPVKIEGEDAFGGMVNYTARIEHCAQGAEIWVSSRAKEDIEQEKDPDHGHLRWTEHRDCEIKGYPEKQTLWSVTSEPLN